MESLPLVACCPPLGEPALSDADADGLERVFKSLADRHRVLILNRLLQAKGDAVCVCDFEAMLDLKQLLDAGLVRREKRGSFAYFSLVPGAFERVRALLDVPALAAA